MHMWGVTVRIMTKIPWHLQMKVCRGFWKLTSSEGELQGMGTDLGSLILPQNYPRHQNRFWKEEYVEINEK